MTNDTTDMSPGARLRLFREAAGKSRPQLAALMACSPESVKAIETGRRELTLTMAVRASRALNIKDLSALFGADVPYTVLERPSHQALPDVRRALLLHHPADGATQSTAYIRTVLDSAWQTWHTSNKQRTETGKVLPALIRDARHAATNGDDRREANRLLAEVYHLTQAWLAWHGDRELCWMSADRAITAAQAADNPLSRARASWYYAHLVRAIGHNEDAITELRHAMPWVLDRIDDDRDYAAAYVDLELCAALTLARAGDESAWSHWEDARLAAERLLPDGYAHPYTRVGQAIVDVYAVMIAVAMGRGDEARRHAANLDPASIPSTERRARHLLELARGYRLAGEDIGAIHLLAQAVDASLETVVYSPPARLLTRELLRIVPPSSREDVERIASRISLRD